MKAHPQRYISAFLENVGTKSSYKVELPFVNAYGNYQLPTAKVVQGCQYKAYHLCDDKPTHMSMAMPYLWQSFI